ncbi:MAG: nitronate monooxygenase family protein [Pseudomonadota bacterium]
MSNLPPVLRTLPLPIIAAPLFIINTAKSIIAQCKAGVVGTMPSLNARPAPQLDDWLAEITETLDAYNKANPDKPAAPFGINLIVNKSNDRMDYDLNAVTRFKVPIIITSLGARTDVNDAIHAYGGVVLHDVINNNFARKAIEKGADGLIAVAAGAGGHAGVKSPFALIQEIRQWFDGPLALSGAISSGSAVLAAQSMGADFAYIGSAFIATHEASAKDAYKEAIVNCNSDDIVYSNLFTGVHGNYLKPSIRNIGLDPDALPQGSGGMISFNSERQDQKWQSRASTTDATPAPVAAEASAATAKATAAKAWKDVWGCGQGIGNITEVTSTEDLVARLVREYGEARARVMGSTVGQPEAMAA